MDKYVLFATFVLTGSLSSVFSAPLKFNINMITKYWQERGCSFPPPSYYNNISSPIWKICSVDHGEDLLNLCNSLVIFSDLICTMNVKTYDKMNELFNQNGSYRDLAKVCNSLTSDMTNKQVEKTMYDFIENRSKDDEVTIISVTRPLRKDCVNYCTSDDGAKSVMCGLLNAVFGSLRKKLQSQVVPESNDGKPGEHRTSTGHDDTGTEGSTVKKDGENVTPLKTRKGDASEKTDIVDSKNTGKPSPNLQVTGSTTPTTIIPVSGNDSQVKDNATNDKVNDNSTEINKQSKESSKPVSEIVPTTSVIKEPPRKQGATVKPNIDSMEPLQNKTSIITPDQLSSKTPTLTTTVKLQNKEESVSPTKELVITTASNTEEKTTKQQQAPNEMPALQITTVEKTTVHVAKQGETEIKSTVTLETPKESSSTKVVLPAKSDSQNTNNNGDISFEDNNKQQGKGNKQEGGQGSGNSNQQSGGQPSESGKKTNTLPKQVDTGNSYMDEESPTSGHFMAYFLTAVVLCVAGYVVFHNKQKIIAFIVEGRSGSRRSRRPNSGDYKKLQPSMEEVMPSLEKSTTSTNYIY